MIHADDGELLDKEGQPIPTTAQRQTWTGVAGQPNPEPPADAEPEPVIERPPAVFRCDGATVQRNMEARDLFLLLGLVLGGPLEIELDEAAFSRLSPDVRQHFRRVG